LDEDDPWEGILTATMFAIRATYHTTLQATPSQLVFGQDAILNVQFEANWNLIRERKQRIIKKNNEAENAKRIPHIYHVNDKVLFKEKKSKSPNMEAIHGLDRVSFVKLRTMVLSQYKEVLLLKQ
jgi:hypothetical protein